MKKNMGIDYGDARTGVALSDLLCSIVGTTVAAHNYHGKKRKDTVDAVAVSLILERHLNFCKR